MSPGKMPDAPKQPDPVRIPSPDDPDLIEARRKKMQEEFSKRQGRSSTQLTPESAPAYTRTALG
jgi:hypothetical protein